MTMNVRMVGRITKKPQVRMSRTGREIYFPICGTEEFSIRHGVERNEACRIGVAARFDDVLGVCSNLTIASHVLVQGRLTLAPGEFPWRSGPTGRHILWAGVVRQLYLDGLCQEMTEDDAYDYVLETCRHHGVLSAGVRFQPAPSSTARFFISSSAFACQWPRMDQPPAVCPVMTMPPPAVYPVMAMPPCQPPHPILPCPEPPCQKVLQSQTPPELPLVKIAPPPQMTVESSPRPRSSTASPASRAADNGKVACKATVKAFATAVSCDDPQCPREMRTSARSRARRNRVSTSTRLRTDTSIPTTCSYSYSLN